MVYTCTMKSEQKEEQSTLHSFNAPAHRLNIWYYW